MQNFIDFRIFCGIMEIIINKMLARSTCTMSLVYICRNYGICRKLTQFQCELEFYLYSFEYQKKESLFWCLLLLFSNSLKIDAL